jgi:hypothetical protein
MSRLVIAASFPVDAEGNRLAGYVQVATTSGGALILDASRDAALPDGASVLSKGAGRYARTVLGTHSDRVLEAVWQELDETLVRGKRAEATALGATIVEDNLTPHRWLGE